MVFEKGCADEETQCMPLVKYIELSKGNERQFLSAILIIATAAVITLTSENKIESIICKLPLYEAKILRQTKIISLFPIYAPLQHTPRTGAQGSSPWFFGGAW